MLLEGMRILDITFTHVGHPLHRGRMTDVESHKGATLASRLTIRFLVVTEERAKGICQQPGCFSLNSRCHRWVPFPSVWSFRHSHASTTSAREIQGDYTHAPRAAMWVNQCRRLGRSVASFHPMLFMMPLARRDDRCTCAKLRRCSSCRWPQWTLTRHA